MKTGLLLSVAGISAIGIVTDVWAGCIAKNNCATLGYKYNSAECSGSRIACPFDTSKYFCSDPVSCTYTITAANCSSQCKNVGTSSCTKNGTTYYSSCGSSRCSSSQTCNNGTCVSSSSSCSPSSYDWCAVHSTCHGDCCTDGSIQPCDTRCGGSGCSSGGSSGGSSGSVGDETGCSCGTYPCSNGNGGSRNCCKPSCDGCPDGCTYSNVWKQCVVPDCTFLELGHSLDYCHASAKCE